MKNHNHSTNKGRVHYDEDVYADTGLIKIVKNEKEYTGAQRSRVVAAS